jgi:hypothetical protein
LNHSKQKALTRMTTRKNLIMNNVVGYGVQPGEPAEVF